MDRDDHTRAAIGPRFDDVQEGDLLQLQRAWAQPHPVVAVTSDEDGDRVLVVARSEDGLEIEVSRDTWTRLGKLSGWTHIGTEVSS